MVDPPSIPVERQARRAKTDRPDALRLLSCLRGWLRGERDRMHPIRVPSLHNETLRHMARERGQLQKEVCQHRDRIRKLPGTVGCWTTVDAPLADRLAADKGALLIEMAWMWVRHQPKSALTQWYLARIVGNDGLGAGKRGKRIAIVAVARRLAIALWRYLQGWRAA